MTEIYQEHHINIIKALASMNGDAKTLAQKSLECQKYTIPLEPLKFVSAISSAIEKFRAGETLYSTSFDLPDTGLTSDPICNSCMMCSMRTPEDMEALIKIRQNKR